MSWLDLVDNTKELKRLYGHRVPSLSGIYLGGVKLHRSNSLATLSLSLSDFPDAPPKEWVNSGINAVQLDINFSGVSGFFAKGLRGSNFVDLQVTRLGEGVRASIYAECVELDITANNARLDLFTGYIVCD